MGKDKWGTGKFKRQNAEGGIWKGQIRSETISHEAEGVLPPNPLLMSIPLSSLLELDIFYSSHIPSPFPRENLLYKIAHQDTRRVSFVTKTIEESAETSNGEESSQKHLNL